MCAFENLVEKVNAKKIDPDAWSLLFGSRLTPSGNLLGPTLRKPLSATMAFLYSSNMTGVSGITM
jgi:hypothetical protein